MTIEEILSFIRSFGFFDKASIAYIEKMLHQLVEDSYDNGYDRGRDNEYLRERGYR